MPSTMESTKEKTPRISGAFRKGCLSVMEMYVSSITAMEPSGFRTPTE